MQSLIKSRKFWIMTADIVVSMVTYFVTRYAAPDMAKDILFLIGSIQPVVLAVIAAITVQNVEGIRNAGKPNVQ